MTRMNQPIGFPVVHTYDLCKQCISVGAVMFSLTNILLKKPMQSMLIIQCLPVSVNSWSTSWILTSVMHIFDVPCLNICAMLTQPT